MYAKLILSSSNKQCIISKPVENYSNYLFKRKKDKGKSKQNREIRTYTE